MLFIKTVYADYATYSDVIVHDQDKENETITLMLGENIDNTNSLFIEATKDELEQLGNNILEALKQV